VEHSLAKVSFSYPAQLLIHVLIHPQQHIPETDFLDCKQGFFMFLQSTSQILKNDWLPCLNSLRRKLVCVRFRCSSICRFHNYIFQCAHFPRAFHLLCFQGANIFFPNTVVIVNSTTHSALLPHVQFLQQQIDLPTTFTFELRDYQLRLFPHRFEIFRQHSRCEKDKPVAVVNF
jgi:hypothetical protein